MISEKIQKEILESTPEQLAQIKQNVIRNIHLQSTLSFVDLGVARYEIPSAAMERVLDRNFEREMALQAILTFVNAEINRRELTKVPE